MDPHSVNYEVMLTHLKAMRKNPHNVNSLSVASFCANELNYNCKLSDKIVCQFFSTMPAEIEVHHKFDPGTEEIRS